MSALLHLAVWTSAQEAASLAGHLWMALCLKAHQHLQAAVQQLMQIAAHPTSFAAWLHLLLNARAAAGLTHVYRMVSAG
jgi:hypothetical protein